jgi:hypothetical protein
MPAIFQRRSVLRHVNRQQRFAGNTRTAKSVRGALIHMLADTQHSG